MGEGGVESRNCIAGRFLLNDLLPARFRKLGHSVFLAFVPCLLPQLSPLSKAHYLMRARWKAVVQIRRGRAEGKLSARIFSTFGHERNNIHCVYVHHDTKRHRAATDIGCQRLKASRNLPFYSTCQSLFLDFISITLERFKENYVRSPLYAFDIAQHTRFDFVEPMSERIIYIFFATYLPELV